MLAFQENQLNDRALRLVSKKVNQLVEPLAFARLSLSTCLPNQVDSLGEYLQQFALGQSPYCRWAKHLEIGQIVSPGQLFGDVMFT